MFQSDQALPHGLCIILEPRRQTSWLTLEFQSERCAIFRLWPGQFPLWCSLSFNNSAFNSSQMKTYGFIHNAVALSLARPLSLIYAVTILFLNNDSWRVIAAVTKSICNVDRNKQRKLSGDTFLPDALDKDRRMRTDRSTQFFLTLHFFYVFNVIKPMSVFLYSWCGISCRIFLNSYSALFS